MVEEVIHQMKGAVGLLKLIHRANMLYYFSRTISGYVERIGGSRWITKLLKKIGLKKARKFENTVEKLKYQQSFYFLVKLYYI